MTKLMDTRSWLQSSLPGLLEHHDVPGASIAVLYQGAVVATAGGVVNLRTRVAADEESVFQVGSITKVWTASLVMQLVDEGLVNLDEPVRTYLPDFALADSDAAAAVTVRHLLNHSAGFEGDDFTDTGSGADAIERYVQGLRSLPQIAAVGTQFSYNNAGIVVLGRLVEVLRAEPYATALRRWLLTPLGLTHSATGPAEAIMFRAAVGHVPARGGGHELAPAWHLPHSVAPAGAMLAMSASDLVGFAQLHLDGGLAPDGARLLSEESITAMQHREVEQPDVGTMGQAWGLGWELFDWDGRTIIGHDGGTIGQSAALRILPEEGLAVAVLANCNNSHGMFEEIFTQVFGMLAGLRVPASPLPPVPDVPIDAHRATGVYGSVRADTTIRLDDDGRLWIEVVERGVLDGFGPPPRQLVGLRSDRLITRDPDGGGHPVYALVGDDGTGRAAYLYAGGRMERRKTA